jgi:hypothetical protein
MDHQPKSGNSVSIQRLHLARVPGFSPFKTSARFTLFASG